MALNADWSQIKAYVAQNRAPSPSAIHRMGGEYGGYLVPEDGIDSSWVVYSFGVGEDLSFERAMIKRYGCEIHAFDPTPRSIEYVARESAELCRFTFHPYGVGEVDGSVRFYEPRNPLHVSLSALNIQGTSSFVELEVRTLETIQTSLGHDNLDLLKMNVEGSELAVLNHIAEKQIEIPVITARLEAPVPFPVFERTLDRLADVGYAPLAADGSAITIVHASSWD